LSTSEILNQSTKKNLKNVIGEEVPESNWIGQILNRDQFEIDTTKTLGEATYGTVYEGQIQGISVAVKQLDSNNKVDIFSKECMILRLLYGDQKKRKEFKMNFHVKCRILRDVARGMKFIHDMKLVLSL